MKKIVEILKDLRSTSSSTDKISILKKNAQNENFKKVLRFAYDKIKINYFVKQIVEPEKTGILVLDTKEGIDELETMLNKLSNREITGNNALDYIKNIMESFEKDSQEVIYNILQRDLKCGFSESSINKAIPYLIPTFDVALAKNYKDHENKVWDGSEWLASRKLDGCRCIAIKENGKFKFFSRKGKEFETLSNLAKELERVTASSTDIVLDGEICIYKDGNEDFTGIMKEIKKKNHTIEFPVYQVFDCLSPDEFFKKESKRKLLDRIEEFKTIIIDNVPIIEKYFDNSMVRLLDQVIVTEKSFQQLQEQSAKEGWEGLILRKNTTYKGKRTDELLKVKKFFDEEFKVVDIEKGDFTYTEAGKGQITIETMKSVTVMLEDKYPVSVGSGWSIDQRKKYFENPDSIIGKTITVQYFEKSSNKEGGKSLRFPTVKHVYENGRNV